MVITHNLGFPRIGANRELKFSLEAYWRGEIKIEQLLNTGQTLREKHWQLQESCDWLPVGDFSFYDQVLDMSFLLGNIPDRVQNLSGKSIDNYFRVARGKSAHDTECQCVHAAEMTKWFDTNYHYIVPELTASSTFKLNPEQLISQINEADQSKIKSKPVIIGPVTYLWLSKTTDQSDRLDLLDRLLPIYEKLLKVLSEKGIEWLQIDEPILVTELSDKWQQALRKSYQHFKSSTIKLLITTYFGQLKENLNLVCDLPVDGIHIDAINASAEIPTLAERLAKDKILSVGIVDGRNIWKTDLNAKLDWLEPLAKKLEKRLWLAPSCSLLHVPVDLDIEQKLDADIVPWLSFAKQKLAELDILKAALNHGRQIVAPELARNQADIIARQQSSRVQDPIVRQATKKITAKLGHRQSSYIHRAESQQAHLKLPAFPTTTIGSFPQTSSIRKTRMQYKRGEIDWQNYQTKIKSEIAQTISEQESIGLDVLVHGEAERNDMVEYFGEQLNGYVISQFGWVQSYGSRCVKPPILFGDISRPKAMTVDWTAHAQSLTTKPVKGMLTGPVTILNWSFVRDDQPRKDTCLQIALAIRQEVQDLETTGTQIIQIDEAALREGLPLRRSQWQEYLDWSIAAFRLAANGVKDETQIHTHMCYSEFNDIIGAIAQMDADVITIENSRSNMELLKVFEKFEYPNEIGPGVYDIHSPNIPSVSDIINLMEKSAAKIEPERLWVNPDCGLKTRQWQEVVPALKNMVDAAKKLREKTTITA